MKSIGIRSWLLAVVASVSVPAVSQTTLPDSVVYVYKLYGQTRKYSARFSENKDTLYLDWGIERNLKWQKGRYAMSGVARKDAELLSYQQPVDGNIMVLPDDEVFGIMPLTAFKQLKEERKCKFDNRDFVLVDTDRRAGDFILLHALASDDGTEMWVMDNPELPLIYSMQNNPCGVNWEISSSLPVSEVHTKGITDEALKEELKSNKLRTGGIYYAYPLGGLSEPLANPSPDSPAPEGYSPVYISHYGRHGSRYMMNDSDYVKTLKPLEYAAANNGLTPLGQEVLEKLSVLWSEAEGRGGELTRLGADQHRGIAMRMYNRYEPVFTSGKMVDAMSSVVLRCVLSMNAFCDQLSEMNHSLRIESASGNRMMRFMSYTSPELKSFSSADMPWQKDAMAYEKSILSPDRVMASIFSRKDVHPSDELSFYKALFRAVSSIQDTDLDISLYKLFTDDELYSLWKAFNYRMYVVNSACPLNEGKGPASASMLLANIVEEADKALMNDDVCVSLRFGHDTALIRLLALMQVDGCASVEVDERNFHLAWQDYRVAPMGANLQLIFYRNNDGHVLVKFLHNENETSLMQQFSDALYQGKYYDWNKLKNLWKVGR